jgi:hypothetical protein
MIYNMELTIGNLIWSLIGFICFVILCLMVIKLNDPKRKEEKRKIYNSTLNDNVP